MHVAQRLTSFLVQPKAFAVASKRMGWAETNGVLPCILPVNAKRTVPPPPARGRRPAGCLQLRPSGRKRATLRGWRGRGAPPPRAAGQGKVRTRGRRVPPNKDKAAMGREGGQPAGGNEGCQRRPQLLLLQEPDPAGRAEIHGAEFVVLDVAPSSACCCSEEPIFWEGRTRDCEGRRHDRL